MGLLDSVEGLINNTGLTGIQKFFKTGKQPAPQVNFFSSTGELFSKDTRVRLKVPHIYVTGPYTSLQPGIKNTDSIVFPYTPQIQFEHKADYSATKVTHSNFQQYFYQHSSVGTISVTGKWTVQNADDAAAYLSTIQLLRGLTKMWTGTDSYTKGGTPPPVCRLSAYGDYMLDNIPVAITTFRNDLLENVDYFTVPTGSVFANTAVPIVSTISLNLIPMYSRAEQQQFGVTPWLGGLLKGKGYL
jgi:hypothetical protein